MALFDCFLRIDGLEGESHDDKHKGEIDVESFSWGQTQSGTMGFGGGGGAGKVLMQDFHFVMKVNKASPKLALACASGEHFTKAVLTCRKAGKSQQDFLTYTYSDLLISSFQYDGSGDGYDVPRNQISINYSKIEFEYKEQKADGTLGGAIKKGWDNKANKAI